MTDHAYAIRAIRTIGWVMVISTLLLLGVVIPATYQKSQQVRWTSECISGDNYACSKLALTKRSNL